MWEGRGALGRPGLGSSKSSRLGVARGVPRVSRDMGFPGADMSRPPWVSVEG